MTVRITALALAACGMAMLAAPQARAQRVSPLTAGKFAQICSSPRNGGGAVCDAYITGMVDTLSLARNAARKNGDTQFKLDVCVPQTATGVEMRGKVLSWLRNHRDQLGAPVGETIYAALIAAYPCNGATGG